MIFSTTPSTPSLSKEGGQLASRFDSSLSKEGEQLPGHFDTSLFKQGGQLAKRFDSSLSKEEQSTALSTACLYNDGRLLVTPFAKEGGR